MNLQEMKRMAADQVSAAIAGGYNKTAEAMLKLFFGNGLGVSIIRRRGISYGGEDGLFELAVLEGGKKGYQLFYDSPVTRDVLGRLSPVEVVNAVFATAALAPGETGLPNPPEKEDEAQTVRGLGDFLFLFLLLLQK